MKKIILSTALCSLLATTSCDILEVDPISDIAAENFYKNAGDAQAALMNVYNYVQGPVTQNFIAIPEGMGDGMRVLRGGNFTNHERFTAQAGQGNVGDMWRDMYFAVAAANDVIESVPRISDPALNKNQIIGEAYFLRGLSFFYLTRLYGDIPLVVTASKSTNQDFNVKRESRSVVFEQIIADLTEAETLLGAQSTNRSRASKGAARALLAKVYLFRNAQGDYQRALDETVEVMADNQYSLVAGAVFADLFTVGKQNTSETIFEISYRPNTAVESHSIEAETVPFVGNNPRVVPEAKIINLFNENPNDLRIPISLGTHNNVTYTRKYQTRPPAEPARATQVPNVILLRLADVILMRAEALNELGQTDAAIPFLNQIRQRAGLPATTAVTQAEVRLAIENERYLELAFEGHRYFDLVRTGRAQALLPLLPDANKLIWPVPARELDLNPNLLPQNAGY